jgi:hypothetical protein
MKVRELKSNAKFTKIFSRCKKLSNATTIEKGSLRNEKRILEIKK